MADVNDYTMTAVVDPATSVVQYMKMKFINYAGELTSPTIRVTQRLNLVTTAEGVYSPVPVYTYDMNDLEIGPRKKPNP